MMRPFDRKLALKRVLAICRQAVKPLGYEAEGRAWKQVTDRYARIIDLQTSRTPLLSELTFTFNLGVFFPELFMAQHGELPKPPLKEYHCCPRERIGTLFVGGDKWWTVTRDTVEAELAGELRTLLVEQAVPWLASFECLEDVLKDRRKKRAYFEAAMAAYALGRDDVADWIQKALDKAPHDLARRHVEIWARDHHIQGLRS